MRSLLLASLILFAGHVVFARAQDANEKLAIRHLRLGQDALQAERFDEAEREFKQAIALDPILELAHYGLGQTYMATRRYVEAVQAFSSARDAFQRAVADQMVNGVEAEQRIDDQIRSLRDQRHALESGRVRSSTNLASKLTQIDDQVRQLEAMRRRDRASPPVTPSYISLALGSAYSAPARSPMRSASGAPPSRSIQSLARRTTTSPWS